MSINIAHILSGQPRCLDQAYPTWQKYLYSKYSTRMAGHFWFDPSKNNQRYRTSREEFQAIQLPNTIDILCGDYRCRGQVELPKPFPTSFHSTIQPNDPGFIYAIQSMWYSRMQAYKQYQLGDKYRLVDWIVVSRIDLNIKSDFHFEDLDPNVLYTYHDCKHTDYCLNDHFAVGTPKIIEQYCNLYTEMYTLYAQGVPFCSETLLGAYMKNLGIKSAHYNLDYRTVEYT